MWTSRRSLLAMSYEYAAPLTPGFPNQRPAGPADSLAFRVRPARDRAETVASTADARRKAASGAAQARESRSSCTRRVTSSAVTERWAASAAMRPWSVRRA